MVPFPNIVRRERRASDVLDIDDWFQGVVLFRRELSVE
jgi:hypothetical protein